MRPLRTLLAAAAAAAAALAFAAGAAGYSTYPLLDQVASAFASRPVQIHCPNDAEWAADPESTVAWGYVIFDPFGPDDHATLAPEVCAGALAIATDDPAVPDWQKALGALVLVHESYHLKIVPGNMSEAITECRAIRHARVALLKLGASEEEADRLMPYVQAMHWRLAALAPAYNDRACRSGWYW